MASRRVHVVRCKDPRDDDTYADVEVLDGVSVIGPDHKENFFKCEAAAAVPFIVDKVGAGAGKGSAQSCTRSSHMERVDSTDPKANGSLFIEVCDAAVFKGPNNTELTLNFPKKKSVAKIVDNTDGGFATDPIGYTRSAHIEKVVSDANPDDKVYIQRNDALSFLTANHKERALIINKDGDADKIDTTVYDSKGDPPDNTDPNVYVKFPDNSQSPWIGNDVKIDQGPLWWIKKLNGGGNWLVIEIFEQSSTQISGTSIIEPDPPSGITLTGIGASESLTNGQWTAGGIVPIVNPVSGAMRTLDGWNPGAATVRQHIIGYLNQTRSVSVINLAKMKRFVPKTGPDANIFTFNVETGGCPSTGAPKDIWAWAIKWIDHCGAFGWLPGNWAPLVYADTFDSPPSDASLFNPANGESVSPYAENDLAADSGNHSGPHCPNYFLDYFLDFKAQVGSAVTEHIRDYIVRASAYKGKKNSFPIVQGVAQWDTLGNDPDALNAPCVAEVFQDSGGFHFDGSPKNIEFKCNISTGEITARIT